jgi:hypothetical protein
VRSGAHLNGFLSAQAGASKSQLSEGKELQTGILKKLHKD